MKRKYDHPALVRIDCCHNDIVTTSDMDNLFALPGEWFAE